MVSSFMKDATVSSFWLAFGRYAWRQLLVHDSLAWRQVESDGAAYNLGLIEQKLKQGKLDDCINLAREVAELSRN
jgi:hypothetical protein